MPLPVSGYGFGGGMPGAPSGSDRSATDIKAQTPGNTRTPGLRPGMVLVGTAHNYGTAVLGAPPHV